MCTDTIHPGRCIVENPHATVTGLNGSAIYHFRVSVIFNGAYSDPSTPSVGLRLKGQQGGS